MPRRGLFDYIYEHLPEFLNCYSAGPPGRNMPHYIDELVEIEVSYTYKYMEVIGCESVPLRSGHRGLESISLPPPTSTECLSRLRHRMDKARALHYVRQPQPLSHGRI